jgi:hypothetical protein
MNFPASPHADYLVSSLVTKVLLRTHFPKLFFGDQRCAAKRSFGECVPKEDLGNEITENGGVAFGAALLSFLGNSHPNGYNPQVRVDG